MWQTRSSSQYFRTLRTNLGIRDERPLLEPVADDLPGIFGLRCARAQNGCKDQGHGLYLQAEVRQRMNADEKGNAGGNSRDHHALTTHIRSLETFDDKKNDAGHKRQPKDQT